MKHIIAITGFDKILASEYGRGINKQLKVRVTLTSGNLYIVKSNLKQIHMGNNLREAIKCYNKV